MNHIKLFESFDSFYKKLDVSNPDWSSFEESGYINTRFTKEELKRILPLIFGDYDHNIDIHNLRINGDILPARLRSDEKGKYTLKILSLNDEYYGVVISSRVKNTFTFKPEAYVCDQFEGLLKLLKDKGIIK